MKKILAVLFVLAFTVSYTFSQASGTGAMSSKTLRPGESLYEYTPTSAYYLGGVLGYDTLNVYVLANKNTPTRAIAYVDVSSRKGSADTYSFDLQAKNFSNESFASVYKGTGKSADFALADTLLFSEIEIGKFYRYWQVQLATDNSCATTDSISFTKITIKVIEF